MKKVKVYFFALLISYSCNTLTPREGSNKLNEVPNQKEITEGKNFELYYSYAGLGSNIGSMQPTFKVKNENYIYTFEQNSFYDNPDRQPEIKSMGKLRTSSIDSIISLTKEISDTLIYKTNVGIMSGGIHNLSVTNGTKKLVFQLHNAYDSTAQKILDIVNSNIPDDKKKLWLFDFSN